MGNGRALSNDLIEKPLISSLGDNTPIGSDYPVWNEFTLQGDYHRPLANAAARAGAAKWIRQI